MRTQDNPFDILGVSPTDRKSVILERAEECALFDEPERIDRAKETLLDMNTRLAAELTCYRSEGAEGYLSYHRVSALLDQIYAAAARGESFAAEINALAACDETYAVPESEQFCRLLEEIKAHRAAAGLPAPDASALLDRLDALRRSIIAQLKECLNDLPAALLLKRMDEIAQLATHNGTARAPVLIEALLDMYEIETRQFADRQAGYIRAHLTKMRTAAPDAAYADKSLTELSAYLHTWQNVMQPLQIYYRSKGQEHAATAGIFGDLRETAIHLHNDGHRTILARRLLTVPMEMKALRYLPAKEQILQKDIALLSDMIRTMKTNLRERIAGNGQATEETTEERSGSGCFAVFAILGMLFFFVFLGSHGQSEQPHTEKPAAQTQQSERKNSTLENEAAQEQPAPKSPAPKPPAPKPPAEPVARSGVRTGYDPEQTRQNATGLCSVTVDNTQNNMPVYVRIWDMVRHTPVRAFYIRQGEEFTAENITPGLYEVRYIELYENDAPAQGAKSEQFHLEQRQTYGGTQYSEISLTLYKVRNGNMQTTSIAADEI